MPAIACFATPIGAIWIEEEDAHITHLYFGAPAGTPPDAMQPGAAPPTPLLEQAGRQLAEYFTGARQAFDLPLRAQGTAFEQAVWQALQQIEYGATSTYGQVAMRMGRDNAARAVGRANHHNPLPIFVPCHRVVGADGTLVGYAGGLAIKRALLALEAQHAATP